MTKAEVVNEIAKKTGIEKAVVLSTVETFMEVVKESLINQEPVYLRGLQFHHQGESRKDCARYTQGDNTYHPRTQHPRIQTCKNIRSGSKK